MSSILSSALFEVSSSQHNVIIVRLPQQEELPQKSHNLLKLKIKQKFLYIVFLLYGCISWVLFFKEVRFLRLLFSLEVKCVTQE